MADLLEQGQVVVGVAVAEALREISHPLTEPGEPIAQSADFALAKAGDAGDSAGIAAVLLLRLGGDQVLNAEFARDRGSDEAVGGRDDRAKVAPAAVLAHDRACPGADRRKNARAHEVRVPP